jgi:hypothetical protein
MGSADAWLLPAGALLAAAVATRPQRDQGAYWPPH